jgi:hypothetical protein
VRAGRRVVLGVGRWRRVAVGVHGNLSVGIAGVARRRIRVGLRSRGVSERGQLGWQGVDAGGQDQSAHRPSSAGHTLVEGDVPVLASLLPEAQAKHKRHQPPAARGPAVDAQTRKRTSSVGLPPLLIAGLGFLPVAAGVVCGVAAPAACAVAFLRPRSVWWMRTWRVSSSDLEKRLSHLWEHVRGELAWAGRVRRGAHPGKVHAWGFSPVWVRMWRVWCSRR